MKIYRCDFAEGGNDRGNLVSWHPSKQEADKNLRKLQKERGEDADGPEGVEAVEIPTDKAGLLGWLNQHFTTDNG